MMMQMTFPRSRVKRGQCSECRLHPGTMVDRGRLLLTRPDGATVEMMQWTCDKCGHTMLFDLSIPRNRPWDEEPGRVEELPIN